MLKYFIEKMKVFFYGEHMKEVIINTEYITLGQLLKMMNLVATGGEVKFFLMQCKKVLVNDEENRRRGRKLRDGDQVEVDGKRFVIKANVD